jgi:peptidylprolyl isomerase
MSDLKAVTAVTVKGAPLSLHDVLYGCKVSGQLRRLLQEAAEDRLIAEVARAENVAVSDDELQQAADAFRQARRLQKAAAMHAWLAEQRLGVLDFQAHLERTLLRGKLRERLPRAQVERYFAENRSQFDRCVLAQIVVERESVAVELLSQIQDDGSDFASLARKHSTHRESRQSGGFLGVVARKSLSPAVEAAVFGAKNGDVLGPFKTAHGWHIVRVEELLPAVLDERTAEAIRNQLFQDWLQDQVRQADVRLPLFDLL